jgi:hypothetical protein
MKNNQPREFFGKIYGSHRLIVSRISNVIDRNAAVAEGYSPLNVATSFPEKFGWNPGNWIYGKRRIGFKWKMAGYDEVRKSF